MSDYTKEEILTWTKYSYDEMFNNNCEDFYFSDYDSNETQVFIDGSEWEFFVKYTNKNEYVGAAVNKISGDVMINDEEEWRQLYKPEQEEALKEISRKIAGINKLIQQIEKIAIENKIQISLRDEFFGSLIETDMAGNSWVSSRGSCF